MIRDWIRWKLRWFSQQVQLGGADHYREGRLAFDAGLSEDDCPYTKGDSGARYYWFSGYFDRRTEVRHGQLFSRYGV